MKILSSIVTAAFVTQHKPAFLKTTVLDETRQSCEAFAIRQRLLERFVNGKKYEPLGIPTFQPGDVVVQKSVILHPETREEIGHMDSTATVLDHGVHMANGAYHLTKGTRVGEIHFSALIPNHYAVDHYDSTISHGSGHFSSNSTGWILSGRPVVYRGAQERDAVLQVCGF